MRYREIIAETGDATTAETWEKRHAAFQQNQTKRAKLRKRITTATAKAAEQSRAAAARRSQSNDKLADMRRDLAAPPET